MPALENVQWEKFAQEIVKGISQRDAYRAAGYAAKSDAAADASASRLLSTAKVRTRIAELQQKVETKTIEKIAVSKAWVIERLVENVQRAMQAEPVLDNEGHPTGEYKYNGSVANRALELIGKEHGMFIDRKEINMVNTFDQMDDQELAEYLEAEAREILPLPPPEQEPESVPSPVPMRVRVRKRGQPRSAD